MQRPVIICVVLIITVESQWIFKRNKAFDNVICGTDFDNAGIKRSRIVCSQRCEVFSNCKGFFFSTSGNCFLAKQLASTSFQCRDINGIYYERPGIRCTTYSEFSFAFNTGGAIDQMENVDAPDACIRLCDANLQCAGVTYSKINRICYVQPPGAILYSLSQTWFQRNCESN